MGIVSTGWRLVGVALASSLVLTGLAVPAHAGEQAALPTLADARAAHATPTWVDDVNYVRALGGLAPITESPAWSLGAAAHSRYLAATGDFGHDEDPASPHASDVGRHAGMHGNVARGHRHQFSAVVGWLASAHHAFWLLNPAAEVMGYGEATGKGWYATLQITDGTTPLHDGTTHVWPADGAVVPWTTSPAYKYTDDCGTTGVGGVAVYVRSPTGRPFDQAFMTVDDVEVASCTFDVNHLFTAIVALDPTPHGATVQVRFSGAGAPAPVTFSTMPAPTLRPDGQPDDLDDVGLTVQPDELRDGSMVIEGVGLDAVTEVRTREGRAMPILDRSDTHLRVGLGPIVVGGRQTSIEVVTWLGGPTVRATVHRAPPQSGPTATTAASCPSARGWARRWVPC